MAFAQGTTITATHAPSSAGQCGPGLLRIFPKLRIKQVLSVVSDVSRPEVAHSGCSAMQDQLVWEREGQAWGCSPTSSWAVMESNPGKAVFAGEGGCTL